METIMADFAGLNPIQLDRVHGGAIRREIGERLRRSLEAELGPAPPHLRLLLDRLAHADRGEVKAEVAA
jgi:hypothetical protein